MLLTHSRRIANCVVPFATLLSTLIVCSANACSLDTDCVVGERTYRVALPENASEAQPKGAIVFVHGYRGASARVMQNNALTALASKLGVVFAATQAMGHDWNLPGVPSADALEGVDELPYFDALSEDLVKRFGIDRKRILVTGFSSGAMMVWHLACNRGASYAGFVPLSGTFWEPIPTSCSTGSISLIHYHGTDDTVVPLQGRQIKDSHQGDVYQAFALLRGLGGYGPVETVQSADLQCARQTNDSRKLLELCLFAGGHKFKPQYIERAWRAFGLDDN